jgi:hypothetical protein
VKKKWYESESMLISAIKILMAPANDFFFRQTIAVPKACFRLEEWSDLRTC